MIKQRLDNHNVVEAANMALAIVDETLKELRPAETFDYGGHYMNIGDYGTCEQCTRPIAEAQAAFDALEMRAAHTDDYEVRAHIETAAELFRQEARAAIVRAELHSGQGSEKIIDRLNGFIHDRNIHDNYNHSHHKGK